MRERRKITTFAVLNQYCYKLDIDPLPNAPLQAACILLDSAHTAAIEFQAPGSWLSWGIIVAIALMCLLISGFVSGSEIAFFGLTGEESDRLTDPENDNLSPAEKKAGFLLNHSEKLLATILVANNLVNITMVVLLSFAINQVMSFNSPVVNFLSQTVALTFVLLLCGEIFPKLVARGRSLKWVLSGAGVILAMYRFFSPISALLVRGSGVVHRFVTKKHESLSADDLSQALEISDVKNGQEKDILEGILSFGEKDAGDIMVSRVDITDIEYHATFNEVVETILKTGFSRIPVYDTTQDNIKGILYSKDLLPYIGERSDEFHWQSLLREPYFVPESRMIDDLMEDFQRKKIHIAVVVDEYGGTRGIVTLEDILEEIVGEIDDEYDDAHRLYTRISDDTFVFDAKIPLTDFCRVTDIDREEFGDAADDVETLAGLLLAIKGDFPAKKEALSCGRCRFLVLDIQKHRIISVRCNILPPSEEQ